MAACQILAIWRCWTATKLISASPKETVPRLQRATFKFPAKLSQFHLTFLLSIFQSCYFPMEKHTKIEEKNNQGRKTNCFPFILDLHQALYCFLFYANWFAQPAWLRASIQHSPVLWGSSDLDFRLLAISLELLLTDYKLTAHCCSRHDAGYRRWA